MMTDEAKEEGTLCRGVCRWCGQVRIVSYCVTKEEADARAAEECDCAGAVRERRRLERVEKARENIDRVFGDGATEYGQRPVGGDVLDFLRHSAELMAGYVCAGDAISGVSVTVPDVCVAKLSVTSKGNVKVSRSETRVRSLES